MSRTSTWLPWALVPFASLVTFVGTNRLYGSRRSPADEKTVATLDELIKCKQELVATKETLNKVSQESNELLLIYQKKTFDMALAGTERDALIKLLQRQVESLGGQPVALTEAQRQLIRQDFMRRIQPQ